MKTRILLTTALAVVALGAVGMSQHVNAATGTGDVDARIVQPITITAVDDLKFGDIAAGTGADTVTIAPITGNRTKGAGDAVLINGGGEQDGTFDLDGEDGLTVTIDVPADGDVVVTSGGDTMAVNTFTWSYDGGGVTTGDGTTVLAVGGPDVLSIGATLSVGAAQPAGTYTDTFDVIVNYQ